MTCYEDLFRLVDDGVVLVFPTEESRRAFSTDYVLSRRKGLLASSVLAFDSFSEPFYPGIAGKKAISDASRAIFASYAASEIVPSLRYFSSPDYPEAEKRLGTFILSMLPSLDDAIAVSGKNHDALQDLIALRKAYGDFLDRTGQYESSFMKPVMPDNLCDRYAIIMPSAFPKEDNLISFLREDERIMLIDDIDGEMPRYEVYNNEKSEIRALFVRIRDLLDSGVSLDEIAISIPSSDKLRPYMQEEAYLFSIPLDFSEGESPLLSSSGSFLTKIQEMHDSGYSLDSIKSFMLDTAIPFRDSEALRLFVSTAVEYAITSAPDRNDDRYMRIPSRNGVSYYRLLRLTADKLMAEKRPEKILPYIHTLLSGLLKDEQFSGNDEDMSVYSFAMKELEDFLSEAARCEDAGFRLSEPLFPLFLQYMKNVKYVPQSRVKGVRVYPFTLDAALHYPYRFIIALNESDSRRIVKKASFMSDYELKAERDEKDITLSLLKLYAAFTDHLHISASSETYSGFVLPLSELSAVRTEGIIPQSDPYQAENSRSDVERISMIEKTGYEKAIQASLHGRKGDDDLTYRLKGRKRKHPVRLSFTSFSSYRDCPFRYAMQYEFGLRDLPSYEADDTDHKEIGARLHSVLERYYKTDCTALEIDIPRLLDAEMELWKAGKRLGENGEEIAMPSSSKRADDALVRFIRRRYLPHLIDAVRMMNEISLPISGWGLEERLSHQFDDYGFTLEGIADRIARLEDGNLVIFDYKKGRRPSDKDEKARKAYQFVIYSLLLSASGYGNAEAAYFITLTDGKMTESSIAKGEGALEELHEAAEGIAEGNWRAKPSESVCSGCQYRGICRRRFSVV